MTLSQTWTAADLSFDLTDRAKVRGGGVWLTRGALEGLGMPEFDEYVSDTPLLDGQRYQGWRAKPREVFWPVHIGKQVAGEIPRPYQTLQRDFWRTMRPGVAGVWRVTNDWDDTYRELTLRFRSVQSPAYDLDPTVRGREVQGILLIADDPWWRGPVVSQTFQTPSTSAPFFATTNDRVLNLMPGNTAGVGTLTNPGDEPVWPKHRLDGPISSFSLRSDSIAGTVDVGVGQWLEIDEDPTRQAALLHPLPAFPDYTVNVTRQLTRTFFQSIQPGASQPVDSVINGSGSLTISIRPAYHRAY